MNHTHSIIQNPQIAIYDKIVNYGDTEGFLCKYCGRTFLTDYELQNHIHRQDDILAESDRDLTLPTNSRSKIGIDTQFVNKNEVKVTNLGNERLRYDKFPGKIGYTRKKGN
jgi:5-methylcytosine-specific restriction endonuclease McrA